MNWFDKWFANKCKQAWENKNRLEEGSIKMNSVLQVERSRSEGEGRITFELSSAVGGRILNVRHYDERKDRHDTQTYVIPSGEDVGERVAKIINLEMFKL
jgi:hypothetical protein